MRVFLEKKIIFKIVLVYNLNGILNKAYQNQAFYNNRTSPSD